MFLICSVMELAVIAWHLELSTLNFWDSKNIPDWWDTIEVFVDWESEVRFWRSASKIRFFPHFFQIS